MLSFRPLTARLRRKLRGVTSIDAAAARAVELSPGITLPRSAAIALPGEWERIETFQPTGVPTWELKHRERGEDFHPATIARMFRNALVADNCVYAGQAFQAVAEGRRRPILGGKPASLPAAQLCSTYVSEMFFGHWLADGLSLELLAEQRGLPALTLPGEPFGHEPSYRTRARLWPVDPPIARVEELWIVEDQHMNLGRIHRLRTLRERLRDPEAKGPKRVFLDRGRTGAARDIGNRDAVMQALRREGFVEVFPEEESADTLAAKLSGAEILIGVEGSALSHAVMLLPRGAAILELQSPQQFTMIWKAYTDYVGIHIGFVVGERRGESFDVPIQRLLKTLELVAARREAGPLDCVPIEL